MQTLTTEAIHAPGVTATSMDIVVSSVTPERLCCCFPSSPLRGQCWLHMLKVNRERLQHQCFSGGRGGFLQTPERREPAYSPGPVVKTHSVSIREAQTCWEVVLGWETPSRARFRGIQVCQQRWALPRHLTESLHGAPKVPSHQGTKRSDCPNPPALCPPALLRAALLARLEYRGPVSNLSPAAQVENITMVTLVSEGQQLLLEKVIPRFPALSAPRGGGASVGGSADSRLSRPPSPRWYPGYQET